MSSSEFVRDSFIDDKDISTTMVLSPDINRPAVSCKAILKKPLLTASCWKVFHQVASIEDCFKGIDVTVPSLSNGKGGKHKAEAKDEEAPVQGGRHSRYFARKQLREYLLHKARHQNITPHPVVTIHQDKLLFETLSRDQSTYCRLDVSEEAMDLVETPQAGTTGFSYSRSLDKGFNKVRDYKQTFIVVDRGVDDLEQADANTEEEHEADQVEYDKQTTLWLRKMLIFNTASVKAQNSFSLDVMDIYNLIIMMKRHARSTHASGIKFKLVPGKPVVIELEPWGEELVCPNAIYAGEEELELPLWGRDRFKLLEPLFPYLDTIQVNFEQPNSPLFLTAEVEGVRCMIGLANTTRDDWSRVDAQDYLASSVDVKGVTRIRVFKELQELSVASIDDLSQNLKLSESLVENALFTYLQAGRVLYDIHDKTYRVRDLVPGPIALERVRYPNRGEARARTLLEQNHVTLDAIDSVNQFTQVGGTVNDNAIQYQPDLIFDRESRLIDANCFCKHYLKYKLTRGPCEHIMAVQILFSQNKELAPIEVE
jgi:hypothetical protein